LYTLLLTLSEHNFKALTIINFISFYLLLRLNLIILDFSTKMNSQLSMNHPSRERHSFSFVVN